MITSGHAVNDGLTFATEPLEPVAGVDLAVSVANVVAWGGDESIYRWAVTAGLVAAEDRLDRDLVLTIGAIAAWRSGALDLRADALRRLARLLDHGRAAVAGGCLVLPTDALPGFLVDQQTRPLSWPSRPTADPVARVGGFRGLGGVWVSPPRSAGRDADGGWLISCADGGRWLLRADVFGHQLTATEATIERTGLDGVIISADSYLITVTGELQ